MRGIIIVGIVPPINNNPIGYVRNAMRISKMNSIG
jgi:hypothetical protein